MNSLRAALTTGLLALAGALPGAAALAQSIEDFPEFSCAELVGLQEIGNPGAVGQVATEIAVLPPGELPSANDPVSAVELLDGGTRPFLYVSPPDPDDPGPRSLGCLLLVVELHPNFADGGGRGDAPLTLRSDILGAETRRLPVLLVETFSNEVSFRAWFENFRSTNYDIAVTLPPFDAYSGATLSSASFGNLGFYTISHRNWSPEKVQFISTDFVPLHIQDFLETAAEDSKMMAVLCGTESCETIWNMVPHVGNEEPAPASAELDQDGTGEEPPLEELMGTAGPDVATLAPAAVPTPKAPAATPAAPAPAPAPAPAAAPADTRYAPFTAEVVFRADSGDETTAGLDQIGGLACLLSALDARFIVNPPDCSSRAYEALKRLDPEVVIAEDGHWILRPGGPAPSVAELVVTAPATAAPTCALALRVPGRAELRSLEPVALTQPREFRALTPALTVDGDLTEFQIVPSDPTSCGVATQTFAVPAEPVVRVSLAAPDATSRVVAHVFALNQGDLESEVKLRPDEVAQFARTLVDSVEAAHTRLAVEVAGQAMALTGTEVFRLDGRSDLTSLLALSAVAMQSNPAGAFANLTAPARAELGNAHAVLSAQDAAAALARVVGAAQTTGASELDIMLIAPVVGRSTQGTVDICTDVTYRNLFAQLEETAGIDLGLWVFPVARLQPEEQPDLGKMSRVGPGAALSSIQATRSTDNGGLYRCAGLPAGLNIFPFYIEDWRSGVEVPARYGVALTDTLSAVLLELSSEE